ncbi:MAG: hypothetical protein SNJ54_14890, partial [Anaerolineae bacterium]
SFDEALARRQGGMPAVQGLRSPGQGLPSPGQGLPSPGQGLQPPQGIHPTLSPGVPFQAQGFTPGPVPPRPGSQPMQPTFPPMQPPTGGLARPSLSQGVPYQPPVGLPAVGVPPSFGTPNNPFDERRRSRRLQDDRYEIYTDEDDAGGGLDMLF